MTADATHDLDPARRAAHIPAGYSPAVHAMRTLILATAIGSIAIFLARRAAPADWLLVPVFMAIANAFEWAFHRGPMHRPIGPRILYRNHSLVHHRAFHHDSMPITEARELELIMMPWYTMLLLFVLVSPVAAVAGMVRGSGLAGVFYLSAAFYFLLYESLHASYHLPEAVLRRLGLRGNRVFDALQSHHRQHHRLTRMSRVNFNVTFPLTDWLAGTKERETVDGQEAHA